MGSELAVVIIHLAAIESGAVYPIRSGSEIIATLFPPTTYVSV